MELIDADLVARVLVDDDQHAFGELVRRHQSTVRGMLRQLTQTDAALADDLAQETFLRAFVEKPVFPRGFIGSHIIAFERTRGGAKNLSASMRNNFKPSKILRLSIPL